LVQFALPLIVASGFLGFIVGATMELRRAWSRPIQVYFRFLQDLLAYDFYIDKIYNYTIVWAVATSSKLTSWFDRYVVDAVVNLAGLATIFSGQGLKYNVSGQSQFYVLTILLGVGLLLTWFVATGQWSVVIDYWASLIN